MKNVHIEFDLPIILASQIGIRPENACREIRRMIALFIYEHRYVSLGKACEIGGMSQWEFAEMNRQLGIPIGYSEEDLKEDLERLSNV